MKNKLGFLGFLGLLGIVGIITEYRSFLSFFAFLVYFRYFNVIPDKLFKDNVRKAVVPGFFINIVVMSIAVVLTVIFQDEKIIFRCFIINYIVSIFIFTILLTFYEFKESRSR